MAQVRLPSCKHSVRTLVTSADTLRMSSTTLCFFFFQAEDGIRDLYVTGVQTCALPICDAGPSAIIEAAKLVGLHEAIMRLPRGYNSEIGEAGLKLSGGQRQRIALARAIFGKPRLVVLDEPNASLDHEGEEALHKAIAKLKEMGTTIVMIAHRPSILGLADKLLVLRNGMVEAYGTRAEVIAKLNPPVGGRRAVPMHTPADEPQQQTA